MKPTKLILISFLSLLFFSNCKKETSTGPVGPAGPAGPSGTILTGDIVGYVYVYDLNQKKLTDLSGVTVTIEGTGFSGITGKDGHFVISNVAAGTYNIAFSKVGYGTTKYIGFKFVGGGKDFVGMDIYPTPLYNPTGLTGSYDSSSIVIKGTLNGPLPKVPVQVVLFVDTIAGVSSDPRHYIFITNPGGQVPGTKGFYQNIYSQNFSDYGLKTGQTVYIVAYSYGWGQYIDLDTFKYVYSNLNPVPSNTIILKVP
jgi:hypothetical protein